MNDTSRPNEFSRIAIALFALIFVGACSDGSGDEPANTGGKSSGGGSGGQSASGGKAGTGGSTASGGATGSGGASGAPATGGQSGSGGTAGAGAGASGGTSGAGGGTGGGDSTLYMTTFNCPEISQDTWLSNGVGCDDLGPHGGWKTANGSADLITSAANHPNGGGGRGFRHWRGDGVNNNGGAISYETTSPESELWIRFHMRYQAGFAWSPAGTPNYTKDIYVNVGQQTGNFTLGFHSQDTWGVAQVSPGGPWLTQSPGWQTVMGGMVGDGKWHCYQAHVKFDTNGSDGIAEAWVDGNQTHSNTNIDFGTQGGFQVFVIGENQATVSGCPNDCYTDYDDFALSTTGPIACL